MVGTLSAGVELDMAIRVSQLGVFGGDDVVGWARGLGVLMPRPRGAWVTLGHSSGNIE